jgi:hypothetical protein
MSVLNVTKEWISWFRTEQIQFVTTIDNKEMFIKTIEGNFQGNQLSYDTTFNLLDAVMTNFCFLEVDKIRLVWSEKLDQNNLQFYIKDKDYNL